MLDARIARLASCAIESVFGVSTMLILARAAAASRVEALDSLDPFAIVCGLRFTKSWLHQEYETSGRPKAAPRSMLASCAFTFATVIQLPFSGPLFG